MWSSVWGHDTCEGRAEPLRRRHADGAVGTLCGAPLWGYRTCEGRAEMQRRCHAGGATET
eukprot:931916-Pyramimonas_sp.AAC.2